MKLKTTAKKFLAAMAGVIIVCASSVMAMAGGNFGYMEPDPIDTIESLLDNHQIPILDENGEPILDENGEIMYYPNNYVDENGEAVFEKVDDCTVRLVTNFKGSINLNVLEDINIDLNGFTLFCEDIGVMTNNFSMFRIFDSVGTGKIIGSKENGTFFHAFGKLQLVLENLYMENVLVTCSTYGMDFTAEIINCEIHAVDPYIYGEYYFSYPAVAITEESASDEVNIELKVINSKLYGGDSLDENNASGGIEICSYDGDYNIMLTVKNSEIGGGAKGGDALQSDCSIKAKIINSVLKAGEGGKEINVGEGSVIEFLTEEEADAETEKEEGSLIFSKDGITVSAEKGVFPENTEIIVNKITSGEKYDSIKNKLGNNVLAFEITAVKNEIEVQPEGKVTVTFDVPEKYNIDLTEIYYIPENGEPQRVSSVKDKEKRTLTVELEHFSRYALVEDKISSPQTGENANMILILSGCIFAALFIILARKNLRYSPRHILR